LIRSDQWGWSLVRPVVRHGDGVWVLDKDPASEQQKIEAPIGDRGEGCNLGVRVSVEHLQHTHTHTKHDRSQNTAPQQKRADQCIDSWLHAVIIHEALVVGSRDADSESFGRPLRNVDLQLVPSLWGLPLRDNERKPNIHRTDGLGVTSTKLWMFGCPMAAIGWKP
jgi:hypothetical protein